MDSRKFENVGESILCVTCMAAVDPSESFCPACGSPVSTGSNLDPIQAIRSEAFLLGRATEGKQKPIVLIGVWIMFFPAAIVCSLLAISVAYNRSGTTASDFIFFWIGAGLAFVFSVILFKVTRNYFGSKVAEKSEKDAGI